MSATQTNPTSSGAVIWDYAGSVEVVIGTAARHIWPYFFGEKKGIWSRTDYTTIAGKPGELGEVYVMTYSGGQLLFEAIRMKPERHLVLKIIHKGNDTGESRLCGYDFISLAEASGKTKVVLQQAFQLPAESGTDLSAAAVNHDKFLVEIFQNLKTLVESGE